MTGPIVFADGVATSEREDIIVLTPVVFGEDFLGLNTLDLRPIFTLGTEEIEEKATAEDVDPKELAMAPAGSSPSLEEVPLILTDSSPILTTSSQTPDEKESPVDADWADQLQLDGLELPPRISI